MLLIKEAIALYTKDKNGFDKLFGVYHNVAQVFDCLHTLKDIMEVLQKIQGNVSSEENVNSKYWCQYEVHKIDHSDSLSKVYKLSAKNKSTNEIALSEETALFSSEGLTDLTARKGVIEHQNKNVVVEIGEVFIESEVNLLSFLQENFRIKSEAEVRLLSSLILDYKLGVLKKYKDKYQDLSIFKELS